MPLMRLGVQFPEAQERSGAYFRALRAPVPHAVLVDVDVSRGTQFALPGGVDAKTASEASDKEVG